MLAGYQKAPSDGCWVGPRLTECLFAAVEKIVCFSFLLRFIICNGWNAVNTKCKNFIYRRIWQIYKGVNQNETFLSIASHPVKIYADKIGGGFFITILSLKYKILKFDYFASSLGHGPAMAIFELLDYIVNEVRWIKMVLKRLVVSLWFLKYGSSHFIICSHKHLFMYPVVYKLCLLKIMKTEKSLHCLWCNPIVILLYFSLLPNCHVAYSPLISRTLWQSGEAWFVFKWCSICIHVSLCALWEKGTLFTCLHAHTK